ncbi:MAG: RNA polymerase sigma factor [Candidatus Kapabacteria bacterium]|nr:RNA polymerase sigma factor [Candidatus Kapabacteria bacterium]
MPNFSQQNDQQILNYLDLHYKYKTLCGPALQEITGRYGSTLFSFILRFVRNRDDVQDLYQDLWINFWNHDAFKDIPNLPARLYTNARNLTINFYHRKSRESILINITDELSEKLEDENAEINKRMELLELCDEVHKAIDLLPDRDREMLILHYFDNHTYQEIAKMLGLEQSQVTNTLRKSRLKRILGNHLGRFIGYE